MDDNQIFMEGLEKKKLPGTLNVLTILTFIGCGIGIIGALIGFATAEANYQRTKDAIDSGRVDQLPSFLKKMMSPEMLEMQRKTIEYKLPIFLITTVTCVLCLIGAIQMRKLKMEGFWIWLIGEILPLFANVFFLGMAVYYTVFSWFSILIVLVFVFLYASQKKHLS